MVAGFSRMRTQFRNAATPIWEAKTDPSEFNSRNMVDASAGILLSEGSRSASDLKYAIQNASFGTSSIYTKTISEWM